MRDISSGQTINDLLKTVLLHLRSVWIQLILLKTKNTVAK